MALRTRMQSEGLDIHELARRLNLSDKTLRNILADQLVGLRSIDIEACSNFLGLSRAHAGRLVMEASTEYRELILGLGKEARERRAHGRNRVHVTPSFSEAFKNKVESSKHTKRELARLLDLGSASSINFILNGSVKSLKFERAQKICEVLKLPFQDFFPIREPSHSPDRRLQKPKGRAP